MICFMIMSDMLLLLWEGNIKNCKLLVLHASWFNDSQANNWPFSTTTATKILILMKFFFSKIAWLITQNIVYIHIILFAMMLGKF